MPGATTSTYSCRLQLPPGKGVHTMSNAIRPVPAGREGLIPHLVCDPCAEALQFYKKAFGAEEVHRVPAPDGRRIMHAAIRIGGRFVFLVDDFPEFSGGKV